MQGVYTVEEVRAAGVHERAQGKGIGSLLIASILTLAQKMSDEVGCVGVLVDAKVEAIPFYERLGFVPLDSARGQLGDRPEPLPMFLELGQVPKAR